MDSLNSFVELLEGTEPFDGNPFRGMGKRKYIQINFKNENIAFEIFAESVVASAPEDRGVGFEETDIIQQYGVIKYDILNKTDNINDRRFYGDFIKFKDFLDKYIMGDNARYYMECYMEMLIYKSQLNEKFLSNMNELWKHREINSPYIYDTTIC